MRYWLVPLILLILCIPANAVIFISIPAAVGDGGRDTFGNEVTGGTQVLLPSGRVWCGALDAPTFSGTLDTIFIWGDALAAAVGSGVMVGLYTDIGDGVTPDQLVGNQETIVAATANDEWMEFEADTISVTGGINYYICVMSEGASQLRVAYDSGSGNNNHKDNGIFYPTWNATFDIDNSSTVEMEFYASYVY